MWDDEEEEDFEEEFEVGDKVEVKNNGYSYTTYTDWFKVYKSPYRKKFIRGLQVTNGTVGTVVEKNMHEMFDYMLYAVELEDENIVILISRQGLGKIIEQEI